MNDAARLKEPAGQESSWLALVTRVDATSHKAAERIAAVGVFGILGIGVATVADIVMRNIFNSPIAGLNEITSPLLAIGVAACLPSGISGRVNIKIDFVEQLCGDFLRSWLNVFGTALFLVFLLIITGQLWDMSLRYLSANQTSAILGLPVAPVLFAVTAIVALTIPLQFLQFLEAVLRAFAQNRARNSVLLAAFIVAVLLFVLVGGFAVLSTYIAGMSSQNVALLCFALMWVAIFATVPLGAAMGLSGLLGAATIIGSEPAAGMFGTKIQETLFNDSLSVLPLFLLMGSFATVAGLSADIYRLANSMFRHLRGGLALATIVGSAGFGALTGSSLATSATIGKVALPEMAQRNYRRSFAAGTVAAGGTLGQLVPPSTVIVVYALLTESSIGTLFIATIVPALLAMVLYMIAASITVRVVDVAGEPEQRDSFVNILRNAAGAWQVILLIAVVVGGLYTGVFTETEAAAVGAVGAFVMAVSRGRLSRGSVWAVMRETTATIAMIYGLIFGAINFSFLIGISGIPGMFASGMTSIISEPTVMIVVIALFYLILGTVMDSFAIMIITVPVFVPLITQLGYEPVWWGILTVCLVEAGMITPPFGLNLFVLKSIDPELRLPELYRGVLPFVLADLVKIALLIAFPAIVLWLPGTR